MVHCLGLVTCALQRVRDSRRTLEPLYYGRSSETRTGLNEGSRQQANDFIAVPKKRCHNFKHIAATGSMFRRHCNGCGSQAEPR